MTDVLIMAGGKGLRLHALTQHRPKPMLPVGSKPMLETLVERFRDQGFGRLYIAVNYKAELITDYFGDGAKWGVDIQYLCEPEAWGTAGALSILPDQDGPFIVQNADVLCDVDYQKLMQAHWAGGRGATMALALYQHQVPYGVAEFDGNDRLTGIAEKPIKNYFVNAGIYVLPAMARNMVPRGPYDMPTLLNRLSVTAYPIEGHWYDVGQFADLAAAHINWSLKVA